VLARAAFQYQADGKAQCPDEASTFEAVGGADRQRDVPAPPMIGPISVLPCPFHRAGSSRLCHALHRAPFLPGGTLFHGILARVNTSTLRRAVADVNRAAGYRAIAVRLLRRPAILRADVPARVRHPKPTVNDPPGLTIKGAASTRSASPP
jgi:hypothetical protein